MTATDKKLILLFGFIVTFSWISQSLMDLAILILVFLFLYQNRTTLPDEFKKLSSIKLVISAFVGYFVVAVLGALINAHSDYAAANNLGKFVWILQLLFFFIVASKIAWRPFFQKNTQTIIQFFAWATFIPVLAGFNVYLFEGVDIFFVEPTDYRIIGLLNSATYHGLIGGLIYSFLLPLIVFNWKNLSINSKIQASVLLTLVFLSTVLTLTRGVWISVISASVVFLYFLKYKKFIITIAVVAIMALVVFWVPVTSIIRARSNSDGCRVKILNTHWRMFKEFPILGGGYRDNLRDIKPYWPENNIGPCRHLRDHGNHAHNQYLNVLATTGLLGFICFTFFHLYFLTLTVRLIKKYKTDTTMYPVSVSLLCMQVFFMISNLTETSFEYGKVRTVLLVAWGLVLALSYKKQPAEING